MNSLQSNIIIQLINSLKKIKVYYHVFSYSFVEKEKIEGRIRLLQLRYFHLYVENNINRKV